MKGVRGIFGKNKQDSKGGGRRGSGGESERGDDDDDDDIDHQHNESLKSSGGTSGALDNFHASILSSTTSGTGSGGRQSTSRTSGRYSSGSNEDGGGGGTTGAGGAGGSSSTDVNDIFQSLRSPDGNKMSSSRRSTTTSSMGGSAARPSYRSSAAALSSSSSTNNNNSNNNIDLNDSSSSLLLMSGIGGGTQLPSAVLEASESEAESDSNFNDVSGIFASTSNASNAPSSSTAANPLASSSPHPPPPPPPPPTTTTTVPASTQKSKHIEESAGTHRLNRILSKTAREEELRDNALISANNNNADAMMAGGGLGGGMSMHGNMNAHNTTTSILPKVERIHDPRNLTQVSRFVSRVVLPPLKIDPTSIGGYMRESYPSLDSMFQETMLCFQCHAFEATSGSEMVSLQALQFPANYTSHKRRLGLLGSMGTKGRHKFKYIIIARSTNRPLILSEASPMAAQSSSSTANTGGASSPANLALTSSSSPMARLKKNKKRGDGNSDGNIDGDDDDQESTSRGADYDTMFENEEVSESMDDGDHTNSSGVGGGGVDGAVGSSAATGSTTAVGNKGGDQKHGSAVGKDADAEKDALVSDEEEEASSFPVFMCMTLHSDGSAPDVRKLIPLDQLTTVQDLHSTVVQLAFRNGDTVRLDFGDFDEKPLHGVDGGSVTNSAVSASRRDEKTVQGALVKERFIWSLLQIHAMLCMSVVERSSHGSSGAPGEVGGGDGENATSRGDRHRRYLPPLNVRNFDRAQLQYVATVNKFLKRSPMLCALLDRQRAFMEVDGGAAGALTSAGKGEEEKLEMEEMDTLAYSMIMGNFNTRVSLFHSESERKDAEEVLNSAEWTESFHRGDRKKDDIAANATAVDMAERLHLLLQFSMRDLEAETCRRLIAWEDEKHYSSTGGAKFMSGSSSKASSMHSMDDARDTVDALALASLFKTLDSLDGDLALMEEWLQDRAAAIKPLTDDCADIEEENRQLEQQWKSYETLGIEMKRLLQGLELNAEAEKLLRNPASYLVYDRDGLVDVEKSEAGVEQIYESGKALQEAIEYPRQSGGLHLKAVSERADKLSSITKIFCTQLAQIIVTVMEQFKTEVVAGSDGGKVSKNDTHSMIAKKIRDTQRKFQSALLGYIKLIEILAALSPEMLPALRDAYAEMVSEGILMKKRCKGYFQALPGKNVAYMNKMWKDIKDYVPGDQSIKKETVNAPDLRAALSELLPVIAREAYFTSALFGSSTKEVDGREKKRNFEATRAAVDNASQNFRYYMNRTCGIHGDDAQAGKSTAEMAVKVDPLLNLVASIYLNEAMDNYIDREKKGGDHSLSLAYVRATILDLRKKVDKQWVLWVEKQMEWLRSNDGVPLSGKRAGIFPSFARFPCYIDHIIHCCSEGRDEGYMPSIANIKVINYYLQKMAATLLESLKECAARETTDQQYASNVMLMENSFFFTQAMKHRGKEIADLFSKQVTKANAICKESTDAYLGWMIKREFAVLHELFSRVSKIRKEHGDKEVPTHVPKNQFVKTLTKEASREVLKERIASVYIRMGKHLSEEGGLLPVAWKALVKVLYEWFGRWEKLSSTIYKHKLDPSAVDVVRIAKAAGGASSKSRVLQSGEFGFKSILALGKDK